MPVDTGSSLLCRRRSPVRMQGDFESDARTSPLTNGHAGSGSPGFTTERRDVRVTNVSSSSTVCVARTRGELSPPAKRQPRELERLMYDDRIVKLSLSKLEGQRRTPSRVTAHGSPLKRLVLIHNLIADVARDRASQRQILVEMDTRLRAEALRELEKREAADKRIREDESEGADGCVIMPDGAVIELGGRAPAQGVRCAASVRAQLSGGGCNQSETSIVCWSSERSELGESAVTTSVVAAVGTAARTAVECAVSIQVVDPHKPPKGTPGKWRKHGLPAFSVGTSMDALQFAFFLLVTLEVVFITFTIMSGDNAPS
eukprot:Opistho-2@59769